MVQRSARKLEFVPRFCFCFFGSPFSENPLFSICGLPELCPLVLQDGQVVRFTWSFRYPCDANWTYPQEKAVNEKFTQYHSFPSIDSPLIFAFFWSLFGVFRYLIFVFCLQFIVICVRIDLVGAYLDVPKAQLSAVPFCVGKILSKLSSLL